MTAPAALRRVLIAVLAGLFAVLPLGSPARANADEQQDAVISFDALTPQVPDRNATIVLGGTVRNASGETLTNVQVYLWRDPSPITDDEGLNSTLTSPATTPLGQRVTWVPSARQQLGTPPDSALRPGESARFQVQAKVSELQLPAVGGIYLMGAHVLAQKGNKAVGRGRLLVPLPDVSPSPQPTPTVVALTSRPSMIRPGLFVDDHLAEELADDGRLTTLLRAASRANVSYLVDPSLLQEVTTMSAGYQVQGAGGNTAPGRGGNVANRWLAEYRRLDPLNGYQIPFGTPDFTALAHNDLGNVTARMTQAGRGVPDTSKLPMLAYASGAQWDGEAVALVEQLRPVAILTANANGPIGLLAPMGTAPLVNFSPVTFAGGPGPEPRTTAVQIRQRLLAESYLDAGARTEPGIRVITSQEEAVADLEADAPWVQRTTLNALLQTAHQDWAHSFAYDQNQRAAELSADQIRRLRELVGFYDAAGSMMVDSTTMNNRADSSIARSASSWWRANPGGYRDFTLPQSRDVRNLLGPSSVSLTAQREVILSGRQGSFPVTVTNHRPEAVKVSIDFASAQQQRLRIPRQENVTIPPGPVSITVNVQGEAMAPGPVSVTAQLMTPAGTSLGKPQQINVTATNLSQVAWIIVGTSGIVAISMTAFRIRQVRRERLSQSESSRTPVARSGPGGGR